MTLTLKATSVRISYVILTVYWICLFLATHSTVPVDDTGPDIPNFDKYVHATAFAILGFLMAWCCRPTRILDTRWTIGFLVVALYAVVDEWTQNYVQQRVADFWDGAADVVGAAFGMAGYCLLLRFKSNGESTGDEG